MKARYERRKALVKEQDAERYLRPENVAKRALLKDQKRVYMQKWMRENKGKHIANANKRRAKKKKAVSGDLQLIRSWEIAWRKRFQVQCYWCLDIFFPEDCQTDHIIAFKHNGKHSIENLCIACRPCNLRKQGKTLQKWNTQIQQPVLML